jgi:hypothetical protein
MLVLRPRIAEIYIQAADLAGGKDRIDPRGVEMQQAHIRRLLRRHLLRRLVQHLALRLNADKIHRRLPGRQRADKRPLADTQLHVQRRLPTENRRPAAPYRWRNDEPLEPLQRFRYPRSPP